MTSGVCGSGGGYGCGCAVGLAITVVVVAVEDDPKDGRNKEWASQGEARLSGGYGKEQKENEYKSVRLIS
jgi:hypothetical protein